MFLEINTDIGNGITMIDNGSGGHILVVDGIHYSIEDSPFYFNQWTYKESETRGLKISIGSRFLTFSPDQKRIAFTLALTGFVPSDIADVQYHGMTFEQAAEMEGMFKKFRDEIVFGRK